MRVPKRLTAALLVAGILACMGVASGTTVMAAGHVVTNCASDYQLSNMLTLGGTITFNCGTRTIILTSEKTVSSTIVIDGGGRITLSGGNDRRLFDIVAPGNLTLRRITLTHGHGATDGGAIWSKYGSLTLDHARITGSRVDQAYSGGAIFSNFGSVTVRHSRIDHNTAGNGGAIAAFHTGGDAIVSDSTIDDNTANNRSGCGGCGGAVLLWDGATLVAKRTMFSTNSGYEGGAIYTSFVNTAITLQQTTFEHNEAAQPTGFTTGVGHGGAINSTGYLSASQVTFFDNGADNGGGAVYGTGMALSDITLYQNGTGGEGGAFHIGNSTISDSTIVGNSSAGNGAGIYVSQDPVKLFNVLLAGNPNSGNCGGAAFAVRVGSLSDDGSCGFGAGDNATNLRLGPLDTNGGGVRTIRLRPGSSAIDAGAASSCGSLDARGVHRPRGASCDPGAYEFVGCGSTPPAPSSPSPANGATVHTRQVRFDWQGPDCATTYRVTYSKVGLSAAAKTVSGLPGSVAGAYNLTAGTWRWRARSCKGSRCTTGPWWTFTVSPP